MGGGAPTTDHTQSMK